MRPDPSAWLGPLEPEKKRNARSWDGSAGTGSITPVGEIQNAATRKDAASALAGGLNVPTRSDLPWGPAARERSERERKVQPVDPDDLNAAIPSQTRRLDILRAAIARGDEPEEIREAWPTWWAVGSGTSTERMWHRDLAALRAEQAPVAAPKEHPVPKDLKAVTDARRERLRDYLHKHGETKRTTLVGVLGYDKGRSKGAAVQQLNDDCKAIGAGPLKLNGRTVVLGETVPDRDEQPDRDERPIDLATIRRRAGEIEPDDLIRPDLAVDATRYLQASAKSGKSVVLTADMARAILAELKVDID